MPDDRPLVGAESVSPCPTCGRPIEDVAATRIVLASGSTDSVGELLRGLTFVGGGYGCYENFDVRPDAVEWDSAKRRRFWLNLGYSEADHSYDQAAECADMGSGYTWRLGNIQVDVCWYWDGDGTLAFILSDGPQPFRILVNNDCKKDYRWEDDPASIEAAWS